MRTRPRPLSPTRSTAADPATGVTSATRTGVSSAAAPVADARVGLGGVEAKQSLTLGAHERSALEARTRATVDGALGALAAALPTLDEGAHDLGPLVSRLEQASAAVRALHTATGQSSPLGTTQDAVRLARRASDAARRAAPLPGQAAWARRLSSVAVAASGLARLVAPDHAETSASPGRLFKSAAHAFVAWRTAFAADPAATTRQFCETFAVPVDEAAARALLGELLSGKHGARAFVKVMRAWMRPDIAAAAEQHTVVVGEPTTLRPKRVGDHVQLGRVERVRHAHEVPTLAPSPVGAVDSLVVVGQGPTGLLTAVLTKADEANAHTQVYVVEKRGADGAMSYTRPTQLAVRHGFLCLLDRARAPGGEHSVLTLLQQRGQLHMLGNDTPPETIDRRTGQRTTKIVPKKGEISAARAVVNPRPMLAEVSVALLETRHLEQALRDVAQEISGLHLLNGYEVSLLATGQAAPDGKPALAVTLEAVGKDEQGRWKRTGESTPIGVPDLIVAADGVQSQTVHDAGLGLRVGKPAGRFVAGTVAIPPGPITRRNVVLEDATTVFVNRAGDIGEAWVIAELPRSWTAADAKDKAKVAAHFASVAADVLELPAVQIMWGGDSSFLLTPTITTEPGRGNFMPVGDASGNNHFNVGGGTVGGAHEALVAALLVTDRNTAESREAAGEKQAVRLAEAYHVAAAWHQQGPTEIQRDLGLSSLLERHPRRPMLA